MASQISKSFRRAPTRHGHDRVVKSFRPLSKKWDPRENVPPNRTKALLRGFLFFVCRMIFLLREANKWHRLGDILPKNAY